MSLSPSEFYEAGMYLPPEVRKDVAQRLLESVDPDEALDLAAEAWLRAEAAAAYDALKADPSRAIPAEDVRARSRPSGPPVHDGRDQLHPRSRTAAQRARRLDHQGASAEIAQRFVSAILDHIDGILLFPFAGRARDDVRPGMRTTTFKKTTLVAYEVDESSGELVVNILGVFHGGQDWEAVLGEDQRDREAGR